MPSCPEGGEPLHVGRERGHLRLGAERDVDVRGCRCRRARPGAGTRRRGRPAARRRRERLDGRQRLRHAAEDDPRPVPLERDGYGAPAGLDPDLVELERPGEDERRAERRVPGERHLRAGVKMRIDTWPSAAGG